MQGSTKIHFLMPKAVLAEKKSGQQCLYDHCPDVAYFKQKNYFVATNLRSLIRAFLPTRLRR